MIIFHRFLLHGNLRWGFLHMLNPHLRFTGNINIFSIGIFINLNNLLPLYKGDLTAPLQENHGVIFEVPPGRDSTRGEKSGVSRIWVGFILLVRPRWGRVI